MSKESLNIVITNVYWIQMRDFYNLDDDKFEEQWDRRLQFNVKAHLWLLHAASKYVEDSNQHELGCDVFVNIASMADVKPSGSSWAGGMLNLN
jgi:NAD(P)-dependent dehydrogenase (short-subunit alcohol dehydrogenase family)